MNDAKYIGLDVHQATISAAVLDSAGKLPMESTARNGWARSRTRRCIGRSFFYRDRRGMEPFPGYSETRVQNQTAEARSTSCLRECRSRPSGAPFLLLRGDS